MIDLYGDELRYCHGKECWYFWDGKRWAVAKSGELTRYAAEVARSIAIESGLACNNSQISKVLNHARSSQSQQRLKAMVELAQDFRPCPVAVDELDADPWKFNCLNGTLNLKTGDLEPHSQDDLISKIAPVKYDPKARYTEWLRFLRRITGNNKALIRYLRRMVGYSLTGSCREHALFILWGKGANGKSTMMLAIQSVMGDYATQAPPDLLAARRNGPGNPFDVADLHGSRLVVDSEVAQNMRMDEAKAKRLTGSDRVKARHIYKDFFEFDPTFKIVIAANDKPKVHGDDDAIFRRLHLVPFTVQIPPEQQDKHLPEKLKAEASGILRWALGGCLEWARDGLQSPACVVDATKEYRSEMDAVGTFIDEACELGKGLEIQASKLYEAYEDWASRSGFDAMTRTMFGKTVKKRGFKTKRGSRGHRVYLGINSKLLDEDDPSNCSNTPVDPNQPPSPPMSLVPCRYDVKDPLSQYLKEWAYAGPQLKMNVALVRSNYNGWAEGEGFDKYDSTDKLVDALRKRGWSVELDEGLVSHVLGISFHLSTSDLGGPRIVSLNDYWIDIPPEDTEQNFTELLEV